MQCPSAKRLSEQTKTHGKASLHPRRQASLCEKKCIIFAKASTVRRQASRRSPLDSRRLAALVSNSGRRRDRPLLRRKQSRTRRRENGGGTRFRPSVRERFQARFAGNPRVRQATGLYPVKPRLRQQNAERRHASEPR